MKRGDPDVVVKLARLLGHKKLSQTYHYLEGLLKNSEPSNAASMLTWEVIQDEFVVGAAARMARKDRSDVAPQQSETALATVVQLPYPTPIGRPRKSKPKTITPKSPSNEPEPIEAGKKR